MSEASIRFGQIVLAKSGVQTPDAPLPVAILTYSLREERETMDWVHKENSGWREAASIVEANAVALGEFLELGGATVRALGGSERSVAISRAGPESSLTRLLPDRLPQ
ncbi:MAG TPA: hypothetical protein VGJ36_04775 [Gemmatimonadales bacterium]|jgi:hypothetical protein